MNINESELSLIMTKDQPRIKIVISFTHMQS